MKEKIANFWVLDEFATPLTIIVPESYATSDLDFDDEKIHKEIIRKYVKPFYDGIVEESKEKVKDSLRYALATDKAPYRTITESWQEANVEMPEPPRLFFVWLWEVLFPGESFALREDEIWIEKSDQDEASHLFRNV